MNAGGDFLHERNPNLHASVEVEAVADYLRASGEAIPNQPANKIESYLGFLANQDYVNDGILTGDQTSINHQVNEHVIKTSAVPESYFELQRRIAREQGHGDVIISQDMRDQMIEAVQADQRAGLTKWVEYLGGDDGSYPNWFKHYAWTSVTKLGSFDKEKGRFLRRGNGTTAPYPDLNREALAYVYDVLNKSKIQGETVDDEKLKLLLEEANFGKLYAHAVLEVTPTSPELRRDTRGSWVKFDRTKDPRTARRLAGSLQGYGTGWCTAGESTAKAQLNEGDFYVYYTRDEKDKDTIPRVAIRMQGGEVAEVRGVNHAQELEPVMADITSDRLKDLPGGDIYIKRAADMKRLTALEKSIQKSPDTELTDEDLRFLYELDSSIEGFGYERDPRIDEIRGLRGNRDKAELGRILPETIRDQLRTTYQAYNIVSHQLGETAISQAELEAIFSHKDQEWQSIGVYDYLVEQLVEHGARHNLVISPNINASEDQIVALAEAFGQDQPYSTYVSDEMYHHGRYTPQQWSGSSGNSPVRLSLIPSRFDEELSSRSADKQREILHDRRIKRPTLSLRVPSLLDGVSHWYALRAGGDKLNDDNAYEKTVIRHFDLLEQRFVDTLCLPYSYVADAGQPVLDYSNAGAADNSRLAVG